MRPSLESPQEITVAVDTEFYGPHSLTIQAACRIDAETVIVQVYRSPAIGDIPDEFDVADYVVPGDYGHVERDAAKSSNTHSDAHPGVARSTPEST
jgi:hypothetical protein